MNLYQIIRKRGYYETMIGECKIDDEIFFIVKENTHLALMSVIEKTKCNVQDLSITKVCGVGEIMGAHFIPVEY